VISKGHVAREKYQCLRETLLFPRPIVLLWTVDLHTGVSNITEYYEILYDQIILKFLRAECLDLNSQFLRPLTYESVTFIRSYMTLAMLHM